MKLTATFPSGFVATRETAKPYTHAVHCAAFTQDGHWHREEVSFACSLQEAQCRADGMGYVRKFKHWSGGRRVYVRSKTRGAHPEIAEVVRQNDKT